MQLCGDYNKQLSRIPGWCFQIFGIFTPKLGGKMSNLTRVFFRWVGSTTNQIPINRPMESIREASGVGVGPCS